MRIGALWNKLANPKNVPRIFAFSLGIILLIGFIVPMSLNPDQIYPRPEPQEQIDATIIPIISFISRPPLHYLVKVLEILHKTNISQIMQLIHQ